MQQIVQKLVAESIITAPNSAKGKLLMASAQLFCENGYEKTTTRDIANVLGIQSGSLFHHVKNKEEILYTVMKEIVLLNTERLRQSIHGLTHPKEKLHALVKQELQFINGDKHVSMAILVTEWRALGEANQNKILELREIYETIWLDVLQEAHEHALIPTPPLICRRLLNGALGWTIHWYKPDHTLSLEELANEVIDLVIHTPSS